MHDVYSPPTQRFDPDFEEAAADESRIGLSPMGTSHMNNGSTVKVKIKGPVLLLMGPLGSFFSRLADFFLGNNVPTHKIMFPLREFFPGKKRIVHFYDGPMGEWREHLLKIVQEHGIKHLFMYGDFIQPHKIAIDLANQIGIEAWVFELGYIRPNYVTLERDRVNARSNLNKPVEFYRSLPDAESLVREQVPITRRWRKIWTVPFFLQHAFTDYKIMDRPHKLQPTPAYVYYQIRGYFRRPWYRFLERRKRKFIRRVPSLFLAVLQVSSDSQITLSSDFDDMHDFIADVTESFAGHSTATQHLVFKHHPRDRGYNSYGEFIEKEAARLNVGGRVHYIHDDVLGELFRHCDGVITINSTVGLSAVKYKIPTKVLGSTFYDLPGLTAQVPLDEFWQKRCEVDHKLFVKFHNFLVEKTQINGSFNGYFPFEETFVLEHAGH